MGLFLLKRLLTLMATLLGASAVVFLVLEILPGNAAQMLMGPDASPEAVAALATKLGLDQPALQRYGALDWRAAGGQYGRQLRLQHPGAGPGAGAVGAHHSAGAAGHGHHRRAGPGSRACMPHRATTAGAMWA